MRCPRASRVCRRASAAGSLGSSLRALLTSAAEASICLASSSILARTGRPRRWDGASWSFAPRRAPRRVAGVLANLGEAGVRVGAGGVGGDGGLELLFGFGDQAL